MDLALIVVVSVFVTWYLALLTYDRFVLRGVSGRIPQTAVNAP